MAAAAIFRFIGDASSLKAAAAESVAAVKGADTAAEASGNAATRWGTKVKMAGAVAGAAMLAAAAGAVAFAKSSVESFENAARETIKLSRLTGGTAEEMSALRFVAQQTGMSADDLANAFVKMSKSTDKARDSADKGKQKLQEKTDKLIEQRDALEQVTDRTAAQQQKLDEYNTQISANTTLLEQSRGATEKWGVQITTADGKIRPMKDLLIDFAEKFKAMPNGADKNALAMEIFGKSGANLIPILNKGRDGIDELMQKAQDFGWVIGQDGVDDMKKNIQAQRDMDAAWEGAKIQLGQKLQPVLTATTVWLAEHLPGAIDWVKDRVKDFQRGWEELTPKFITFKDNFVRGATIVSDSVSTFIENFKRGYDIIKNFLDDTGIADVFIGIWNAIYITVKTTIDQVIAVWNFFKSVFTGDWAGAWQAIKDLFRVTWEWILALLGYVWNGIKEIVGGALGAVWNLIRGTWDWIIGYLSGLAGRVWGALSGMWGVVTQGLSNAWSGIQWIWGGIWGWITGLPGTVGGALGDMWGGMRDAFKGAINWIIDKWNNFSLTLPKVSTPFGDIGGWSLDTPNIPRFAAGRIVSRPTLALVGERNTEVVFPTDRPGRGFDMLRQAGVDVPSGSGDNVTIEQHLYSLDARELAGMAADEMAWALKGRK